MRHNRMFLQSTLDFCMRKVVATDIKFNRVTSGRFRFYWHVARDDGEQLRVGFSCRAQIENSANSNTVLTDLHRYPSASDGGACYGIAAFSVQKYELLWVQVNGEA